MAKKWPFSGSDDRDRVASAAALTVTTHSCLTIEIDYEVWVHHLTSVMLSGHRLIEWDRHEVECPRVMVHVGVTCCRTPRMGERRAATTASRMLRANDPREAAVKDDHVELSGEIDINTPNFARIYDFLLGGAHNFASDRRFAAMAERAVPFARDTARLNRTFLRRAVHFMIGLGIRQFLDIGSGIPTVGNVHEIAQAADPTCRVVYVDKDRMAVVHSQLLLQGNDTAVAIQADIRDPEDIIDRPEI